jgi:hypothetical protein
MNRNTLKQLIRKEIQNLSEAVGVPANIDTLASEIYNQVVSEIDEGYDLSELMGEPIILQGDFNISDLNFNAVVIKLDFSPSDDFAFIGMDVATGLEGGKNFNLTVPKKEKFNMVIITFRFMVPVSQIRDITGKDIKDFLAGQGRVEVIASISHELKHFYDGFKSKGRKGGSITRRAAYKAYTEGGFPLKSLTEFMYNLYFVHEIENTVRSSELAGAIRAGEITKKDFYEFLTQNRVYQRLKLIRDYSFQDLKSELMGETDAIKKIFDANNVPYSKDDSDEKLVDTVLEIFVVTVADWKYSLLVDITRAFSKASASDKKQFFAQQKQDMARFEDNPQDYFEYEIKNASKEAGILMKKLSKLYSITPDDKSEVTNENIVDWKRWYKLMSENNPKKIVVPKK